MQLAAHSEVAQGKRVDIVGYLAVDLKVVSLYATEHDYLTMDRRRSVEILAPLAELKALIDEHGNSYVRLEGVFTLDQESIERGGRLGAIKPPIAAIPIDLSRRREGVDDITYRLDTSDE